MKTKRTRSGKKKTERVFRSDTAGIDLGSRTHYVAVSPEASDSPVRTFQCYTSDLEAMTAWLKSCGVRSVAMEATGVYWIPVYQVLEQDGLEVLLVNARHYKNVEGRKTDVQDCQWLQHLHSCGLLRGSFRPENAICVLRSYMRQREGLVKQASQHLQRMQKALEQMNVQLHKVISDIGGESGMRIIQAILKGERDPRALAQLRNYRVRRSAEEIEKALIGDYREEHLFCLRQELALYDFVQVQIGLCDRELERRWTEFQPKADPAKAPAATKPKKDTPLRLRLYQATGVDLTAVDGFDAQTVQTLLSETGTDMSKWPSEKHFTSWLRICPNNFITGGRIRWSRVLSTKHRAANAFRIAAWTLANSDCYLGAYYRRMRGRKGPSYAVAATAHKLARIYYRTLKYGQSYINLGADHYEKTYKERIVKNAIKRIRACGVEVALLEKQTVGVAVS